MTQIDIGKTGEFLREMKEKGEMEKGGRPNKTGSKSEPVSRSSTPPSTSNIAPAPQNA